MDIPNHARRRLAAGELFLGMGVRQARTVDIGTIARTSGFDWLFIDMEHRSMDVAWRRSSPWHHGSRFTLHQA